MLKKNVLLLIGFFDIGHWIIQRLTALFLIVLSIISFVYNSLFLFILFIVILSFHIFVGLSVLVHDYMHDNSLSLYVTVFIRIFVIYFLKSIFVFSI